MTYWPLSVQQTAGRFKKGKNIYTQVPGKHKQVGSNYHRVIAAEGQSVIPQEHVVHGGRKTLEPIRKPGWEQEEIDPSEKPEASAVGPHSEKLTGEAVVKMAEAMLGS